MTVRRILARLPWLAVVFAILVGCDPTAIEPTEPARRPTPIGIPAIDAGAPAVAGDLDLGGVADPDERAAIRDVVADLDRGDRPRYRRDGTTFENRERRLPPAKRGYYREYTVKTPGERDRGARRIVAGERGELYYSRDHYKSFIAIRPPRRAP